MLRPMSLRKVMKFGGAALADGPAERVCRVVRERGELPIVVVSAHQGSRTPTRSRVPRRAARSTGIACASGTRVSAAALRRRALNAFRRARLLLEGSARGALPRANATSS
jgi:aspartokinase